MYLWRAEDEGDNNVPMYKEKLLARRQKGTQTVHPCRVEDESDKRVLMYKEKSLARDTADPGQVRSVLLQLPTMTQLSAMSTTRNSQVYRSGY